MIGSLTGKIIHNNQSPIIIDVNGVGYLVYLPDRILKKITPGETKLMYIYTHVKEDLLELFGFESEVDLKLFKLLISVSGIGPKTGLNIIDRGAGLIQKAVIEADVDFFTTIPRLGKKNAQKIIIELKSKLGSMTDLDLTSNPENNDVMNALLAMGFHQKEILDVIKNMPANTSMSEQIRFCLKHLAKNKIV